MMYKTFDYDRMEIQVCVLANSRNTLTRDVLTTYLLRIPRYILAELNTHRMLSRNAASSRAIPCKKLRRYAQYKPVWMQNCAGMQAYHYLEGWKYHAASLVYSFARGAALLSHLLLEKLGVHKQQANRLIEPFSFVDVVVSGTDWENFFHLRCDESTDDNFRYVAKLMTLARTFVEPVNLHPGEWHVPLLPNSPLNEDWEQWEDAEFFRKRAVAQLARVSYMNLAKAERATIEDDFKTYDKLVGSDPKHLSPLEHVAKASEYPCRVGNFSGFIQLRKMIKNEDGKRPL